jgi:hypothetical protein
MGGDSRANRQDEASGGGAAPGPAPQAEQYAVRRKGHSRDIRWLIELVDLVSCRLWASALPVDMSQAEAADGVELELDFESEPDEPEEPDEPDEPEELEELLDFESEDFESEDFESEDFEEDEESEELAEADAGSDAVEEERLSVR